MSDYFDIFGTLIKFEDIKKFRIVQREYIYRPAYAESEKSILNTLSGRKFVFCGMQPYAAIIDEKGNKSSLSSYKAKDFKESVGKDVFEDVRSAIGDKFNVKSIKSKKYTCVNQTGRIFTTYLEDIPAQLGRRDGKFSDVRKNDELYPLLGEPIAPAINIVPALTIIADEDYTFYGNGIQLQDVSQEYERLKYEYGAYLEARKDSKSQLSLSDKFAKIKLPGKKQAAIEDKGTGSEIAKLKQALSDGIITQEEYEKKLVAIIDKV